MKHLFISIFFYIVISCAIDKPKENLINLVWEDNFKGSSLDTNFWNIYVGNGCPELCGFGNNELQYYTNEFSNLKVENGKLTAPINTMRFDDSVYSMLGENLVGLTANRELLIDSGTYEERSTSSARLPGAIINNFKMTL